MHTTRLRRVGGSVMLAVPPPLLDLLNLQSGAEVGLTVDRDRLIVQGSPRRRYTLDELLAQTDPAGPLDADDQAWTRSEPAGTELI